MNEFRVYNSRPIIRTVIIVFTILLEVMWLFAFVIGQIHTYSDVILAASLIGGTIIVSGIFYLIFTVLFGSQFIFNEKEIIRYIGSRETLRVNWDQIISIGHYAIIDIFGVSIGPGVMEFDYIDDKNCEKRLTAALSFKAAWKLKGLNIHPKLANFISKRQ